MQESTQISAYKATYLQVRKSVEFRNVQTRFDRAKKTGCRSRSPSPVGWPQLKLWLQSVTQKHIYIISCDIETSHFYSIHPKFPFNILNILLTEFCLFSFEPQVNDDLIYFKFSMFTPSCNYICIRLMEKEIRRQFCGAQNLIFWNYLFSLTC